MREIVEDKGRIRPVVEGDFQCDENGNSTRVYDVLSMIGVVNGSTKISYISKKRVPIGIPITDDNYWYPFQVISVPKGDKGDDGKDGEDGEDGVSPILRVSPDGMSLEISSDNGETWLPFVVDFNKLRVIGYIDSIAQLPRNAQIGDIYGVWESKPTEENPEAGVYRLYINTVKDWLLDYTITKVYDYDTELPSSATDGTAVLVPVRDLTLDKEKVDGYKVYRYNQSILGWTMVLNTAEIYAEKEDIINYGDNIYALVQGATEGTYELYARETGWVYFGTNASITYHLVQDISEGTATNVLSGKAVKDCCEDANTRIRLLARGVNVKLTVSPATIYKNVATTVNLTGTMSKATPTQMNIIVDGVDHVSSNNPYTYSPQVTVADNTKTFSLEGIVEGMTFTDEISINARYPIYYAFGASAASVAVNANRFSATTSAVQTYQRTNNANGQRFYILVPSDITDVSSFTMGGAPFVMNPVTTQTINGVSYRVHESANVYNNGVTLKVSATY